MPEEAADTAGRLRQLAHVSDDGALELLLAARRGLAGLMELSDLIAREFRVFGEVVRANNIRSE